MSNDALDREVAASDAGSRYAEVQQSTEYQELRRKFRRFVFPMTALFLAWYFLYVLLAAFAPEFMAIKLFGNINVGLVLGLGQFASTSPMVNRPVFRTSSATSSRATSQATRKPIE